MNAVERVRTAPQFGGWRFDYRTQVWTMAPDLLAMYELDTDDAHDVEPVFERIPEPDRTDFIALVTRAIEEGSGFSGSYAVEAGSRGRATFLVVGEVLRGEDAAPCEVRGYSIDVSEDLRRAGDVAVAGATRHRRAIEQVKGALMLAYGIDADNAFALLQRCSNTHNVKLGELAERTAAVLGSVRASGDVSLVELLGALCRDLCRDSPSRALSTR